MKLEDIEASKTVEEGFGRSTNIFKDFFKDIVNLPNVDKLVAEHGTSRGHAFMIRGKDGNAYEIQIHPAKYGDYFQDNRKSVEREFKANKQREQEREDHKFR